MKTRYLFAVACLLTSMLTYAQPGALDHSFSDDGWLSLDFGGANEQAGFGVAVNSQGRILVGGRDNGGDNFLLAMLNTDGSTFNFFSGDGKVLVPAAGLGAYLKGVALQPDGKVIAAGTSYYNNNKHATVARVSTAGALDNTFGIGGVAHIDLGAGSTEMNVIALQPDGKILWAGYSQGNVLQCTIARFNADGAPDNTFGGDGVVVTEVPGKNTIIEDIAIMPDGKILAISGVGVNSLDIMIIRYNTDGSLDNTFGGDGIITSDLSGGSESATSILLTNDNKMVVSGVVTINQTQNAFIARYNLDGTIDNTFSDNGWANIDFGISEYIFDMLIQPDGKFILAGRDYDAGDNDALIMRINTDGTPDNDFGNNGIMFADVNGLDDDIQTLAFTPDLKVVAVGRAGTAAFESDVAVWVYLTGLSVGIVDFTLDKHTTLVYPNPIQQTETLEYTLAEDETISIQLLDNTGKLVTTFIENQPQKKGDYKQILEMPTNLPQGNYLLQIVSPKGKVAIQVVK